MPTISQEKYRCNPAVGVIRAEPDGSGKQAELGLEFREFFRPVTSLLPLA